jgi:ABC-type Zn2+ transport system substrate-binding protein/surface adhesin
MYAEEGCTRNTHTHMHAHAHAHTHTHSHTHAHTHTQHMSVFLTPACNFQSFLLLLGEDLPAFNNAERMFMIIVLLGGALLYR